MKTGMVTSENDFFNKKEVAELSQIQLSKQVTPIIIFQCFLSMSFLLLLQAGFELECKKQSCSFHKR